ncbi:unnamed protein product [Bursaphelenchus okinawaensis]|uniref:Uncharacterized protein n=1 Tax=Bursaphelenchus okinawaensis TaxID=465554 RepID=A0A811LS24_9BILA|nr:unnamed protein product [Bursaphelenchus okinawaensis]CAG9127771.1 unnamed protein product [Bursaphelenchus okinawaensis]
MGCRLSSYAKPETVNKADQENANGVQQHQVSSVGQGDYIDGIDISRVGRINIFMYGDSTELTVQGYIIGSEVYKIRFCDEYDVILEKLKLCLKKKRKFVLQIYFFDDLCVWSPSLLNVMADFFLNTLPAIDELYIYGAPENVNVSFIDFCRKIHPIVERLAINNPTILRFLIDFQIKSLAPESTVSLRWMPLKYTQANLVTFNNWSMLEVLAQQDIVMQQVRSATFYKYQRESSNLKLIFENVFNMFPSLEHLTLEGYIYVREQNEPILNHELFTYTRTVFDTFERMLDWNQGKLNIIIIFFAYFNVPVNEDLARKMTEFAGYECCYKNGYFVLEVSMSNVDLRMVVQSE